MPTRPSSHTPAPVKGLCGACGSDGGKNGALLAPENLSLLVLDSSENPETSDTKKCQKQKQEESQRETKIRPSLPVIHQEDELLAVQAITPEGLWALYLAMAPDNWEKPVKITKARDRKLRAYTQEFPAYAWWVELFQALRRSPLLTSARWRNANIDWLLSKHKHYQVENCVRVHEGVYREAWEVPLPKRTEANARALASFVERG